jgi:hypothetical protein
MEVDCDEDLPNTPPEVKETANLVTLELSPLKLRARYEREYDMFMRWRQEKKIKNFSESVQAKVQKSSTEMKVPKCGTNYFLLLSPLLREVIYFPYMCYKRLLSSLN